MLLNLTVFGVIFGLLMWMTAGLSPVIAYPLILFAIIIPQAVKAWRLRGTPGGPRAARLLWLYLGACFGMPLFQLFAELLLFFAEPEPVLNRLYTLTGVQPGRYDVVFLRTHLVGGMVGLVVWLIRVLRRLRARHGENAD
jgi:hypothetical protein